MTSDELKIDKRIVERNIKHGRLDAVEYERMLSALPDLSDKVWRKPHTSEATVAAAAAAAAHASVAESEPASAPAPEIEAALPPAVPATFYSQG
jgi:hypothetical protein